MTTAGPFSLEADEGRYLLLIDGSWLDADFPIQVGNDKVSDLPVGDDPRVTIRLNSQEGVRLWKLLDITIGAHWREGEVVRREVMRTKREGLSTRIPERCEYEEALEVLDSIHASAETRQAAEDIITVYERVHGMRAEGR